MSARQATSIGEINSGLNLTSNGIQSDTASIEEVAAATGEMAERAERLEDLVTRFKLVDGGELAEPAEDDWADRAIAEAVSGIEL